MKSTGFPPLVRTLIYERAAGRCERCDEWASDVELHHRRPRGIGGSKRLDTNVASNGVLLCAECHRHVESHRFKAFDDGWLVRQSHAPAAKPVFRREQWVYLDDEGGFQDAPGAGGWEGVVIVVSCSTCADILGRRALTFSGAVR